MLLSLLYMALRVILRLASAGDGHDREVEILVLRPQAKVLSRKAGRPKLRRRDRIFLAAASRVLPKDHWSCFIVTPQTLLRWHRELVRRKWTYRRRTTGRPRLDPEICALAIRMARENPRWGYIRIQGELRSSASVWGRPPSGESFSKKASDPRREDRVSWSEFLRAQADGILACDFFTVETAFLKTLYVLFFIEIGSRRLRVTPSTRNPDGAFVTQQARNLCFELDEREVPALFLIRDRDGKYSGSFDEVFRTEGAQVPHADPITQSKRVC